MRHGGSFTSSIVGFALAVLLVAWALEKFAAVVEHEWLVLLIAFVVIAGSVGAVAVWRRNRW